LREGTQPTIRDQRFFARDRFRCAAGESTLAHYEPSALAHGTVAFCRTCSSSMPIHVDDSDCVMIPAGAIDQEPGIRPQAPIHVASKASWDKTTDA
jgi:hypothetical protein